MRDEITQRDEAIFATLWRKRTFHKIAQQHFMA